MSKADKVSKQFIDRKMYKGIKKYDRQQMEQFAKNLYTEGFKAGFDYIEKIEVKIETDIFIAKIKEILRVRLGIGNVRFNKSNIERDIKDMFQQEQEVYRNGDKRNIGENRS
ncbi:hypothetical protein [Vallitalea guaymasensis]|uniref:hypothetical protein n=1 Tax=Vallitalea guaymasensis TaxID=1185412 RepID=UPI002352FB51|nr:hypothetical protein [Vallitalea guaymasensis]